MVNHSNRPNFDDLRKQITADRDSDQTRIKELEKQLSQIRASYEKYKHNSMALQEANKKVDRELNQIKKDYGALKQLPSKLDSITDEKVKDTMQKYEKLKVQYNKIEREKLDF